MMGKTGQARQFMYEIIRKAAYDTWKKSSGSIYVKGYFKDFYFNI
jgi:hypothetical protein